MKTERPLTTLGSFLPADTLPFVLPYFEKYNIHLSLTGERKSILGNYRSPSPQHPYHRISVNATLNVYSFLITLLHEIAHLENWVAYQRSVLPHGQEWKKHFKEILVPFLRLNIFPPAVFAALTLYLQNPAASTCTDPVLFKALYHFNHKNKNSLLVDDVPINAKFTIHDGRIFLKKAEARTRAQCIELKTGKVYLFPGIYEVLLTAN